MLNTKFILHPEDQIYSALTASQILKDTYNITISNRGIYNYLRDVEIMDRYNSFNDPDSIKDLFIYSESIVYTKPDEVEEQKPNYSTYKLSITGKGIRFLVENLPAYLLDKKINKRPSVKKKTGWEPGDEILPQHRMV